MNCQLFFYANVPDNDAMGASRSGTLLLSYFL
ncbi:MAG: hypothetical protein JWQ27_514 [Ferruginibacter sp.]|nr:hypothetical protein [Ferruginibacter sp.]